jgi:hypothetical protein
MGCLYGAPMQSKDSTRHYKLNHSVCENVSPNNLENSPLRTKGSQAIIFRPRDAAITQEKKIKEERSLESFLGYL